MKSVELYYNPYINTTRLFVEGNERHCQGRRIDEFIVGQPIDNWLSPYVYSYHRWDGVLAEIMDDLNDDEIEIHFYSVPSYCSKVLDELQLQADFVEGRGYSSKHWKCECTEYYLPGKMKNTLVRFIQAKRASALEQYSMNLFDYCEQNLLEEADLSVEFMRGIYNNIKKAIDAAKKYCEKREEHQNAINFWEKSGQELLQIFGSKDREGC